MHHSAYVFAILIVILFIHKYYCNARDVSEKAQINGGRCSGSGSFYSPVYNSVISKTQHGCYGPSTQPMDSVNSGTLPLYYNHTINSVSARSQAPHGLQEYGPHSNYRN